MIRWSRRAGKSTFKRTEESFEGKNWVKSFVFEPKFTRKTRFSMGMLLYYDWYSNPVFQIVPTVLHLFAAKREAFFSFCILKKMTKVWTCRRKLRSSTQKKYTIKHFDSSKTYFVLTPRYCYLPWINWRFLSGITFGVASFCWPFWAL
jgi:hypothetical protein